MPALICGIKITGNELKAARKKLLGYAITDVAIRDNQNR
jgi:hypothetical protein